jgi:hypothetical protein
VTRSPDRHGRASSSSGVSTNQPSASAIQRAEARQEWKQDVADHLIGVNYSFRSCCLIQECYRRVYREMLLNKVPLRIVMGHCIG